MVEQLEVEAQLVGEQLEVEEQLVRQQLLGV